MGMTLFCPTVCTAIFLSSNGANFGVSHSNHGNLIDELTTCAQQWMDQLPQDVLEKNRVVIQTLKGKIPHSLEVKILSFYGQSSIGRKVISQASCTCPSTPFLIRVKKHCLRLNTGKQYCNVIDFFFGLLCPSNEAQAKTSTIQSCCTQ